MTNKYLRAAALMLGSVASGSIGSLMASTSRVDNVKIPFSFQVEKKSLPAGDYRIEEKFGSEVVTLVNATTGQRIQFIWPASERNRSSAKLTFVQNRNGYRLKPW